MISNYITTYMHLQVFFYISLGFFTFHKKSERSLLQESAQRVEKVSTRWETSKKVGIFFVLAFVGGQEYARVQERKKQASARLSR